MLENWRLAHIETVLSKYVQSFSVITAFRKLVMFYWSMICYLNCWDDQMAIQKVEQLEIIYLCINIHILYKVHYKFNSPNAPKNGTLFILDIKKISCKKFFLLNTSLSQWFVHFYDRWFQQPGISKECRQTFTAYLYNVCLFQQSFNYHFKPFNLPPAL